MIHAEALHRILISNAPGQKERDFCDAVYAAMKSDPDMTDQLIEGQIAGAISDGIKHGNWPWTLHGDVTIEELTQQYRDTVAARTKTPPAAGMLDREEYENLIERLTDIHGEDLINIMHRVFAGRSGELFKESYTDMPGDKFGMLSFVAIFDVPEVTGESGDVTPPRQVTLAMTTREKK